MTIEDNGGDLLDQMMNQALHHHHFMPMDFIFYHRAPEELKPLGMGYIVKQFI